MENELQIKEYKGAPKCVLNKDCVRVIIPMSIYHISEETLVKLQMEADQMGDPDEAMDADCDLFVENTGNAINLDFIGSHDIDKLPEDLRACIEWAAENGFNGIDFIEDCSPIDGIPLKLYDFPESRSRICLNVKHLKKETIEWLNETEAEKHEFSIKQTKNGDTCVCFGHKTHVSDLPIDLIDCIIYAAEKGSNKICFTEKVKSVADLEVYE